MLGIFNRMIRNSTGLNDWDVPDHWKHQQHTSSFERQRKIAAKHRAILARDAGLR